MTTFFVWWIFINKNNMNFQATFTNSGLTQEQRFINASSWSTCLAYCEGTGLEIFDIQSQPRANVVIHDSGTTNCYQAQIKYEGLTLLYFVWANDFNSFMTWFDTLTDSIMVGVQNQNKLYVTV